jgi:mono/diheme cytochrome c family protein
MPRIAVVLLAAVVGSYVAVAAERLQAPRIWDDAALAEWATPVAGLNVPPGHYSSAEYYAVPADNLRTYPVYPVDREPPGYWEWLQKQKPAPLVDAAALGAPSDWIAAGERAFHALDSILVRTNDTRLIAQARDVGAFQRAQLQPDGSFGPLRWVVTAQGVMLSGSACASCHAATDADKAGRVGPAAARAAERASRGAAARERATAPLSGPFGTARRLLQFYTGDSLPVAMWREFATPWAPDARVERMKTMSPEELQQLQTAEPLNRSFEQGMFARANGSPYNATKILDLKNLRYSRYVDATATHRLRGPEDVARYAALVTGADAMDFGPHRMLTDAQRRVRFRYADEVLYAIGLYLMSLEPPKNPEPASPDLVKGGEQIFRREGCVSCHVPPAYTSGKLTLAQGWRPPEDHPNRDDILAQSVGTDPELGLKTRKGTGLYKIPSLRGVWYRRFLLHDGSLTSLEDLFDRARLDAAYEPRGWNPPGVTKRAVQGHTFGTSLPQEEKTMLLAFLRSL